MTDPPGRYTPSAPPRVAEGWALTRLTPVSRMYGANGILSGADGRVYVAECLGSRISAVDVESGAVETISPVGGDVVGPDDLAFDGAGNMYITEFMDGRVSVRGPDGRTRILRDDLPGANGITYAGGRLFVDECRSGGRLLELDLQGGAPRVVLDDLPFPNALALGPDGFLYFPLIAADEIWRVHPDGGAPERVISGLGRPLAVKFDPSGRIVSTQSRTGEVLRIDPRNGRRAVLATLDPGMDNLTFSGDRLFVSFQTDGRITEVLDDGTTRNILPGGFHGPMDLTLDNEGRLYIADQFAFYELDGSGLRCLGTTSEAHPGCPGGVRGLSRMRNGVTVVTTWGGRVGSYCPRAKTFDVLAEGLDQPYGIAVSHGLTLIAELGAGRIVNVTGVGTEVVASGLRRPTGLAVTADGSWLVSEAGAGRVVRLDGSRVETLVEDLVTPQGIAVQANTLYIVDAGRHEVISYELDGNVRTTIAANLPVGAPPLVVPKPLHGAPPFSGPLGPFAGIEVGADGAVYVSADTEGSVIALRPNGSGRRLIA